MGSYRTGPRLRKSHVFNTPDVVLADISGIPELAGLHLLLALTFGAEDLLRTLLLLPPCLSLLLDLELPRLLLLRCLVLRPCNRLPLVAGIDVFGIHGRIAVDIAVGIVVRIIGSLHDTLAVSVRATGDDDREPCLGVDDNLGRWCRGNR